MDVWIICIPVIDSHPIEPRTEIGLHLLGEIAGEGLQVGHVAGILWRDDESEMMPVIIAALSESRAIGAVAARIEHLGALTTPAHTVTLQIREMGRQWR